MAVEFDPYYLWLGIPPDSGLRHHYRLLGIDAFEADENVIDSAANRLTTYVKSVSIGEREEVGRRILSEIADARMVLLTPNQRARYDEWLRAEIAKENSTHPVQDGTETRAPASDEASLAEAVAEASADRSADTEAGVGSAPVEQTAPDSEAVVPKAKAGPSLVSRLVSAVRRLLKEWWKELVIYGGATVVTAAIVAVLLLSGQRAPVEPAQESESPPAGTDNPAIADVPHDSNAQGRSTDTRTSRELHFSTVFDEPSLESIVGLKLDVPDSQVASIELDASSDELVLTTTGQADMWIERNNAPIAYTTRPDAESGQTWFAETHMRLPGNAGRRARIGGLVVYPDRDGAGGSQDGMEWSLEVNEWDDRGVEIQAFGNGSVGDSGKPFINPEPAVNGIGDVYLRLEVTENGSSDDYSVFYKLAADSDWQLLGAFSSSVDNSRVGLFLKTGMLDGPQRRMAFGHFKVGIVPAVTQTQSHFVDEALIGYWPFDESDGDKVFDGSKHSHDGTSHGVVRTKRGDQPALDFEGAGWIDLENPPAMNFTGTITVAAWIRPDASDGYRNILVHGFDEELEREVLLRLHDGRYEVGSWTGEDVVVSGGNAETDLNTWIHLAGTYDGTQWRLYRNGQEIGSLTHSQGAVEVEKNWSIGAMENGSGRHFDGGIDDVLVYSRALTADEVVLLYESSSN